MKRAVRQFPYSVFKQVIKPVIYRVVSAGAQTNGPVEPNESRNRTEQNVQIHMEIEYLNNKGLRNAIIRKSLEKYELLNKRHRDNWRVICKKIKLIPCLTVYQNQGQMEQRCKCKKMKPFKYWTQTWVNFFITWEWGADDPKSINNKNRYSG